MLIVRPKSAVARKDNSGKRSMKLEALGEARDGRKQTLNVPGGLPFRDPMNKGEKKNRFKDTPISTPTKKKKKK